MNPDAYPEMARTEDQHWWFVARRQILASYIDALSLPHPARILEIGAGTGGNLRMLARYGSVTGIERDAGAREFARAKAGGGIAVLAGSVPDALPSPLGQFDLVCLFDVLEHVERDVDTLRALRSLLSPQGRIVITVPAWRWLWSEHDEFLHHHRRYSRRELAQKLQLAGLRPTRLGFFNALLFPLVVAGRVVGRLTGGGCAGRELPSRPVNAALRGIFGSERHVLRYVSFPFGVSLIATCVAADGPR